MKNLTLKAPLAIMVSLFFLLGAGCSSESNKEDDSEDNTSAVAPAMEEDEPQENNAMNEAPVEDEVQATTPSTSKIKMPENKKPVLTAMSTSYKEWNTDGNNILDKDEFYQGLYKVWDADKNNRINQTEFQDGANKFFADYSFSEFGRYEDWDSDNNANLSMEEFREGIKGTVDQEPVGQELLVIWDLDNDDKIERIELDNIVVRLDKDDN